MVEQADCLCVGVASEAGNLVQEVDFLCVRGLLIVRGARHRITSEQESTQGRGHESLLQWATIFSKPGILLASKEVSHYITRDLTRG